MNPVQRLDTDLGDEEIQQLVTEMYLAFYFRPSFVKFALGRIKEPAQLRRGIEAAAGISKSFVQGAVGMST